MTNKVRVRFAPSPTGHLHIGGARTALFNYLFARHQGGTFILRIEDTDKERSTREFLNSILEGMKWLGMEWDEGPFYQSRRLEGYREHVQKLLDGGKAYRCYCTPEELEAKRKALLAAGKKPKYDGTCRTKHEVRSTKHDSFCIRFKAPQEGSVAFNDLCRGAIQVNAAELDDMIILRADGTPTYNLTVVVDDVTMDITHVIRGDDHLNNTPRQIQLYQALGFPLPRFAHLPMIHGADKKKLSKRHGAVSVIEYQQQGFLPEALLNYLARLGWSHGDQEIFTKQELIEKFDLEAVGKSPSIFDIGKCTWVNHQHLNKLSDSELAEKARPYLETLGLKIESTAYAAQALHSERERGKTLQELSEISAFYFRDALVWDEKAKEKWLNDTGRKNLKTLLEKFKTLSDWKEASLQKAFQEVQQNLNIQKMVDLAQPLRVAMTGTTVSPGIFEVLAILGRERVCGRLRKATE